MLTVSPRDRVFILAVAGVSAESGIPTFRGISAASCAITVSAKGVTPLPTIPRRWKLVAILLDEAANQFSAGKMTDAQEPDTFVGGATRSRRMRWGTTYCSFATMFRLF
jgi:hypothetical protein